MWGMRMCLEEMKRKTSSTFFLLSSLFCGAAYTPSSTSPAPKENTKHHYRPCKEQVLKKTNRCWAQTVFNPKLNNILLVVYFVFPLYYFFIMSSICLCVSVQDCIYQLSRLAVWAQPHPADHAWGLRWASSLVSSSAESSPRKHTLPAAAAIHQSDAQIRQTTNTHIRLAAKQACNNGITHGCLCLRHWVRGRGGRVRLLSQWILLLLREVSHVPSRSE